MKRRRSKIVILLLLAIYLVSGLANAGGTALCAAGDGHVEFETATNGVCAPNSAASFQSGPLLWKSKSVSNSHCGPCIYVPISIVNPAQHFRITTQDESPMRQPATFASFPADAPVCANTTSESLLFIPPLAVDGKLTSLHTVILLI